MVSGGPGAFAGCEGDAALIGAGYVDVFEGLRGTDLAGEVAGHGELLHFGEEGAFVAAFFFGFGGVGFGLFEGFDAVGLCECDETFAEVFFAGCFEAVETFVEVVSIGLVGAVLHDEHDEFFDFGGLGTGCVGGGDDGFGDFGQ